METCELCSKEISFERSKESEAHEYEVCCECGCHICYNCSRQSIYEDTYCEDCFIEQKNKDLNFC